MAREFRGEFSETLADANLMHELRAHEWLRTTVSLGPVPGFGRAPDGRRDTGHSGRSTRPLLDRQTLLTGILCLSFAENSAKPYPDFLRNSGIIPTTRHTIVVCGSARRIVRLTRFRPVALVISVTEMQDTLWIARCIRSKRPEPVYVAFLAAAFTSCCGSAIFRA